MSDLTISADAENVAVHGTERGDETSRRILRSCAFVWSRGAAAWVLPRNLRPETRLGNTERVRRLLTDAGYAVTLDDTGRHQSEAERRATAAERLEARADRYDSRAVHLAAESEAATDLTRKAENIRRALAGTPTSTLRNRIDSNEAEVRRLTRRIDGTGKAVHGEDTPAEGDYRERLLEARSRAQEALDLDRAELQRRADKDGVKVWGPGDFKPGDRVAYWGGWGEVARVNPKTLSVKSPQGYSWPDKVKYQEVKGHRPAELANA